MKKINFWQVCVYLIFYSFIGFILETSFGFFTKGVIESRKSFMYGPFCAIYGIGATIMIFFLKNEKGIWKIFFKGIIIGAFVEYAMSLFCEKIFNVKWWDYSNSLLNINGRTCLIFALMWGGLAIILMKIVNPFVDKTITYLLKNKRIFKSLSICMISFFVFDAILTSYALKTFYYRIANEKNLDIENKHEIQSKYLKICKNENIDYFNKFYFGNAKMLETYPNLIICGKDNHMYYIDTLIESKI